MIKFSDGAHWYTKDGLPMHDADLREARKKLLYTSVTTVDKEAFKNDFLDRWLREQLAIAAFDNQPNPGESKKDYCNRIYQISIEKGVLAAEFGREIHDAINEYPQLPLSPKLIPFMDVMYGWYKKNILSKVASETVILDHQIGVAGRGDLKAITEYGLTWIDWKSQDVKKDDKGRKKPVFYDSWLRQLAFYSITDAKETSIYPQIPTCMSVIIDSNEPDTPFVKVWDQESVVFAYRQFITGAWQWHAKRKYWPVGAWRPEYSLIQIPD
jgi:hypothetical protein